MKTYQKAKERFPGQLNSIKIVTEYITIYRKA